MPKTPWRFKIAAVKSAAIVFADPFLRRPIARLLRARGLTLRRKKGPVDYVIDDGSGTAALDLARENQAKYLRLCPFAAKEEPLLGEEVNWRLLRTGYLLGPAMPPTSPLARAIIAAVRNEPLVFPWAAEDKIYPLAVEDLAAAVWQALVLPETRGKRFLILGQAVSGRELADFLQNLGQVTRGRRFSSPLSPPPFSPAEIETSREQLRWRPQVSWQEAVEEAFRYFCRQLGTEGGASLDLHRREKEEEEVVVIEKLAAPKLEPEEKREETESEEEKIEKIIEHFHSPTALSASSEPGKKGRIFPWRRLLFLCLGLIIFFLLVWLKPLLHLFWGYCDARQALVELRRQSWREAERLSEKAKGHFCYSEHFFKGGGGRLFGPWAGDLARGAEIGRKGAAALQTAVPLAENALGLIGAVLRDKPFNFEEKIPLMANQEKELAAQLALIEALLRSSWSLPPRWRQWPQNWAREVKTLRSTLIKGEKIISHLPWLVAAGGQRRTFLVLLQNNMELRPTGGFIGSFALMTFEDGVLTSFEVKDVYAADGQLKGHVEPPKQIKEILGEETWYLRDANWNPDFARTARNVEWFLRKELGREVDGVISFNLTAAQKVIGALGEIYLPDFNEKIDGRNLFERAEFWAEHNFFPGSTQKSAFLGLLGKQLFANIKAARPEEYLRIGRALLAGLEEKEILLYFHQPQLAQSLYQLNWDGRIKDPQCALASCFSDYLYLVEANLGVNKANYFLRRSLEEAIDFQEEKIVHRLKINYENTAVSSNWPGGEYVNWLRIYLPRETKIEEIAVFDPLRPQEREIIGAEKREEGVEGEKEVVGFLVRVPVKQKRTVLVRFSHSFFPPGDRFGYLLYWQKQSGFRLTPVSLLISFPDGWQPLRVNPAASLVGGKLLFSRPLEGDLTFAVEFGK